MDGLLLSAANLPYLKKNFHVIFLIKAIFVPITSFQHHVPVEVVVVVGILFMTKINVTVNVENGPPVFVARF